MFKKKPKKVSSANLYVCVLGLVDEIAKNHYKIEAQKLEKPYAILEPTGKNPLKFQSPIYDTKYYYFEDIDIRLSLDNFVGQIMVYRAIPLVQVEGINKLKYTTKELKYMEDELNKKDKKEDTIEDSVMIQIKNLADKASNIFDEKKKDEILKEINSLGVFYVTELIQIRSKKESTNQLMTLDPEAALMNECIKKIIELEEKIARELENNSLFSDLNVLERNIRGQYDRK